MDLDANGWWLLLGVLVVLLLWRLLLGLAIYAGAGALLFQIWIRDGHELGSKLIASAVVVAVAVWLAGRVRGPAGSAGRPGQKGQHPGVPHRPPCVHCADSGWRACYACHGGGQDFTGDRAKPCGWCSGGGRIRCTCKG